MGLRICDGYAELLKYLRSDIQEVASRLQKGGLGYLDVNIEDQVMGLSEIYDFSNIVFYINLTEDLQLSLSCG